MEALEEGIVAQIPSDDRTAAVVKGKRSKRQRIPSSMPPLAEFSGSTTEEEEEEEDMANCLILLAQGHATKEPEQREVQPATTITYECRTCNRCFPTFQALGGHRASHKKHRPVILAGEPKAVAFNEGSIELSMNSFHACSKTRVHECSICGSEFSSGQALGGHMRRHRQPLVTKKESLDLNLPAPSDGEQCYSGESSNTPSVAFGVKRPILFSTSALVHCYY